MINLNVISYNKRNKWDGLRSEGNKRVDYGLKEVIWNRITEVDNVTLCNNNVILDVNSQNPTKWDHF